MRRGEITFTEALRLLELPDHLQAGVYEQSKQHGYTLDAAIRITTARLDTEAKAAEARQRLADEGTRLIVDPADEFGSDQVHLHHLWDENDITAAKTADICVAHIDTHGRVEYFATTPKPWPWQPPAPAPAVGPSPRRGQTTPTPPTPVTMPIPQKISTHTTEETPPGTTRSPRSSAVPPPNSPPRCWPSSPCSAGKTMKTKTSPLAAGHQLPPARGRLSSGAAACVDRHR